MKKNRLPFVLIGLLFIAMAGIIIYYARPIIYHPKKDIYNRLLKDTPMGSNKKRVLEYIRTEGYVIDNEPNVAYEEGSPPHRTIGDSYVRVNMGHYQGIPWRCDVVAVWVFDKDEKLIHIDVWKEYDAF
jgi:hypothetical protein